MLRRLPTILATLAFGVHSLLGCCVHHAHGREAEEGECRHSHDSGNHTDDTAETDPAESAVPMSIEVPHLPGECPPAECEETRCEYLTAAGGKAPHPADAPMPVHLADLAISVGAVAGPNAGRPPELMPLWLVRGERCAPIATQVWRL